MSSKEWKVFDNVYELVSGIWPTPLVKLRRYGDVWAKLESFNALSSSIKDRVVWYVINKLINNHVKFGMIEEASSGNTAIALSLVSNILGVKCRVYLPKNTPKVTEALLKIIGADIVKTDFEVIDKNFWTWVKKHAESIGALNINQFENEDNPQAHYDLTGSELVQQFKIIDKKPQVLIAGIGTSGHIAGIARKLIESFGKITIIGVVPSRGSNIPGIKRVESGVKWIDNIVDEVIEIDTREAVESVLELARNEGLLVGLSSGAVFNAFKKVKDKFGEKTYLLIFPDNIYKYIDIIEKYINEGTVKLSLY